MTWDGDADQASKPKPNDPQLTGRQLGRSLIGLGIIVALFIVPAALALRDSYEPFDPQRRAAAQSEPADEAAPPDLMRFFDGSGLNVGNPAPLDLRVGEALELRNRDTEVKVTPGGAELRSDGCSDAPLAVVPVTVVVEKGSAEFDPGAYRLRTVKGVDVELVPACTRPAASVTTLDDGDRVTVEMAFPATDPGWLVWDPDRGYPQAMWRLS